ncbi:MULTISPECIES: hypothetical protein [Arsenicicoccus]|uniref:hypothetical protein n=1 Tax=Arsenicicoccus TaxID=267408 RepID=UPI00257E9083|nr:MULTISPECIES: hypothetical protein [Arsenicicoccus]
MSEQRPEDQRLTGDDAEQATGGSDGTTSLDELNDAGAGAGADKEGSTFEPEEDD